MNDNMENNYKKIRTVVAHSDDKVRETIVNSINELDYASVIGIAKDGKETLEEIINLSPDVVFTGFYYPNMNGIEIFEGVQKSLKNENTSFNIIEEDTITDQEWKEAIRLTNNRINAVVRKPYEDMTISIMEDYKKIWIDKK